MESIQKIVNENPDSVEIGTPGKGGCIKVYGDFSKKDEFKAKIAHAIEVRAFFENALLEEKKNV